MAGGKKTATADQTAARVKQLRQITGRSKLTTPVTGKPLSAQKMRFIDEFMVDMNQTGAAKRAGYNVKSAKRIGCMLMHEPMIREEVKRRQEKLAKKFNVTVERIVDEYKRIAFSDIRDFVTWGPDGAQLKPDIALTEDQARAVLEVKQSKDGVTFKLHDKKGALDSLGKHFKMFLEQHEHSGSLDMTMRQMTDEQLAQHLATLAQKGATTG